MPLEGEELLSDEDRWARSYIVSARLLNGSHTGSCFCLCSTSSTWRTTPAHYSTRSCVQHTSGLSLEPTPHRPSPSHVYVRMRGLPCCVLYCLVSAESVQDRAVHGPDPVPEEGRPGRCTLVLRHPLQAHWVLCSRLHFFLSRAQQALHAESRIFCTSRSLFCTAACSCLASRHRSTACVYFTVFPCMLHVDRLHHPGAGSEFSLGASFSSKTPLCCGTRFSLTARGWIWLTMCAWPCCATSATIVRASLQISLTCHECCHHAVLRGDYSDCLRRLMKFPPVGDVSGIVEHALHIRDPLVCLLVLSLVCTPIAASLSQHFPAPVKRDVAAAMPVPNQAASFYSKPAAEHAPKKTQPVHSAVKSVVKAVAPVIAK